MTSHSAQVSRSRPFYADHAAAYDLLVADPVEPWVEAVHEVIGRAGHQSASVLDAGCGTGRHAAALTAKGHRVDLADAAGALLAQAAHRCPGARCYQVDICSLQVEHAYQAVACRGVLNDMITDGERDAALRSLASSLHSGGLLILDVREASAARDRADATPRRRIADLGSGRQLAFTSTVTWQDGTLHVHEVHDVLTAEQTPHRSDYDFVMRPWSENEIRQRLGKAGFRAIEIGPGAGRKTTDRLFVTAVRE